MGVLLWYLEGVSSVTRKANNLVRCEIDIIDPRTLYNGERLNLMK